MPVNNTMNCGMARKAAETAGLTPVVIDSISQQYAQQMHNATNRDMLNLLQERFSVHLCQAIRPENEKDYSDYVRKAVQYIDVNLSESIGIPKLADFIGLSKPYLAKLFHDEVGLTIKRYIAKERMRKAAELMTDSSLSIQDIGSYVGYYDNNYFA